MNRILHRNSIDDTISSTEFKKYVVNTINSRLELPFNICASEIDVCHPPPSKKKKKKKKKKNN